MKYHCPCCLHPLSSGCGGPKCPCYVAFLTRQQQPAKLDDYEELQQRLEDLKDRNT